MIKGSIINNTGKPKHIFKRTVYPGQQISLEDVYSIVSTKIDKEQSFVDWLQDELPDGWEVRLSSEYSEPVDLSNVSSESLTENGEEDVLSGSDSDPSLEFASPKTIDKLTAKDIFNLRIKDNPKRVIKQISSVHKLRRALTLCRNDSRKNMLANILRHRIKEITG